MARTIVILGGSFAAVPVAHYLLKHTATKLEGGLKVVLVSPNTHVYWVFASVRGILPNMLPEDKLFLPIDENFAKYPQGQFEHVLGTAARLNPESNSVLVRRNDGAEQTISYDHVVIATGSSYIDTPFKNLGSTEETRAALREWSKKIESAKSIVVAGAGYTGVELAGELGEEYASAGLKEITFLVDKDLPFTSEIKTDVRATAKKELENLKVKVLVNSRATRTSKKGAKTAIELNGGEKTITADLFIPTFGVKPNTSFVPAELLDTSGFVKQTSSLRAEGQKNVYVIGDAGNLQEAKAITTDMEVVHLVKILDAELLGRGDAGKIKVDPKVMFATSIGKSRGTGQVGNWRPWSFIIWWMKSRHLGTDYGREYVAGLRTLSQKKW